MQPTFRPVGNSNNRNNKASNRMSMNRRVDTVLGFFSSRPNWDSPTPSPVGECAPSPLVQGVGSTHSGERMEGSQFRRGDRHCGIL